MFFAFLLYMLSVLINSGLAGEFSEPIGKNRVFGQKKILFLKLYAFVYYLGRKLLQKHAQQHNNYSNSLKSLHDH